jgi:ammonium transporter, Amt family
MMTATPIGNDVFFVLLGAILVFAMHGGFAFLEAGTVRHKNQVNALVKILADFAVTSSIRQPNSPAWKAALLPCKGLAL